mmetsp:Transcript_18483/g.31874  ORF Transcript_18483/g.31874 Transcript_18483/m.31874 type:complete len:153 (+) Transcript_18483:251-709(+)
MKCQYSMRQIEENRRQSLRNQRQREEKKGQVKLSSLSVIVHNREEKTRTKLTHLCGQLPKKALFINHPSLQWNFYMIRDPRRGLLWLAQAPWPCHDHVPRAPCHDLLWLKTKSLRLMSKHGQRQQRLHDGLFRDCDLLKLRHFVAPSFDVQH